MAVSSGAIPAVAPASTRSYPAAMALVTALFFMWGFLTVLNDILVPHLKAVFELNYTRVMLIQFSFFAAYVLLSVPVGKLVGRIGYQAAMVAGLAVMGCGALLFLPASAPPSYPLFLGALFVLAAGMTVLQVSCNPYVAVLGPPETASSRLNLAQAFNSVGTAIAPWFGGLLILVEEPRTANPAAEAASVRMPYLGFAAALFCLALLMWRAKLPVLASIEGSGADYVRKGRVVTSAWRVPHLLLGAVGIFTYCGAEVSIGSFLVNYFAQPDIGGLAERVGARYVSYYWLSAMAGRFLGAALLRRVAAGRLLALYAVVAFALVWTSILTSGPAALWAIIAVGLFNSIMFPTIFTLAIDGLGRLTSQASGIIFVAALGPALVPVLQGALADRIGVQASFALPAVCYLYVVYYGLRGHRR